MNEMMTINGRTYVITITKDDICINDSHNTPKRDMYLILDLIKEGYGEYTEVFEKRSRYSLKMEWICHNLLYRLNIKRDRTADVDLDTKDRYEILYRIFGWLAYIFVK